MNAKTAKITGLMLIIISVLIFGLVMPAFQRERPAPSRDTPPEKVFLYYHNIFMNLHVGAIISTITAFFFGIGLTFLILGFVGVKKTAEIS